MLGMREKDKIKIPIGDRLYQLVAVRGEIRVNGRTFASACRHDRRTIEVSDRVPLRFRAQVAAAAVSVAWDAVARGWRPIPLIDPEWEV
jgi:hypothetical protein